VLPACRFFSSREISHMQASQCGNQEAYAEVLCRRRRAVRAIAARANLPQFGLSCQLAPHTSGPRDVSRCGALSLLQKMPYYRGVGEIAARLNANCAICLRDW
jgi:hypothetical protein